MLLSIIAATLEGCPREHLTDAAPLERLVRGAVDAAGLTLLNLHVHQFSPGGVTAAAVLSESHLAVHTWPEHGLLFIDIATCSGPAATLAAFEYVRAGVPHGSVQRRVWTLRGGFDTEEPWRVAPVRSVG